MSIFFSFHTKLKRGRSGYQPVSQQQGVALITVLMITLIIMVLSVSLAVGVFSEHRLSRNAADLAIARQAAEAALRDAEHDIACEKWDASKNTFVEDLTTNPQRCPLQRGKQNYNPQACTAGWVTAPLSVNGVSPVTTKYFSNQNCYRTFGQVTGQPSFNILGVASNPNLPRYSIEVFSKSNGGKVGITNYRITARGYGRNSTTTVDLQSIFRPVAQ
jgi:type IV pilus assembly protein PilX